jgi:hypothetical protein
MDGVDLINAARMKRAQAGLAVTVENSHGDHVTYYAKDEADKQRLLDACERKGNRVIAQS